jgi:hypothetical protein
MSECCNFREDTKDWTPEQRERARLAAEAYFIARAGGRDNYERIVKQYTEGTMLPAGSLLGAFRLRVD